MELLVKRTSIEVAPYESGSYPTLEYLFAVWDYTRHCYDYKGLYYDDQNSVLFLPRGMDVHKVENILRTRAIIDKSYAKPADTGKIMINSLPKNDVQKKTIKFILGMGEYSYTKDFSQLSVNLITGKGKTYVTIASLAYMEKKFIIITSLKGWLQQWITKVQEYTDIRKKEICQLSSSIIMSILEDKYDLDKVKMFTCTHKTITSCASELGWDKVTELFNKIQVAYKVFDEAHLYFDSMCNIDFHTNVCKTLYLTASPGRSNQKEDQIYKMYFEQVPSIELFDPDTDRKVKYLSVHFTSHPSSMQIAACKNKYGLNKSAYVSYLMANKYYWKLMFVIFCEAVLPSKGKTLILVEINKAIFIIKDWIREVFPELRGHIGCFFGETPEDLREVAKQQRIIITNRQCGGTCMDVDGLSTVLMAAVPAKSKLTAQQTFGRVGREGTDIPNMIYIDIVDEGFRILKEYYTFKQSVFMKYASECSKVLYRDYDLDVACAKWEKIRKNVNVPIPFKHKVPVPFKYNIPVPFSYKY